MVPHGPVTKSQSDIMPNVAHNGLTNAFSQLINPLSAFFDLLPSSSDLHRPRPLTNISSCKAPIIDNAYASNVIFEEGGG